MMALMYIVQLAVASAGVSALPLARRKSGAERYTYPLYSRK
jgi:hypothetical protein